MDEGPESDGRRARSRKKAAHRVEIHRVNDCVLGHVGQVSYKPIADDDAVVGDLSFGRMDEHTPSFRQLAPFEEWIAPTRTSLALPASTVFQRTKSQKNWLFKTHAEAFLGNLNLPGLISEETRAQKAGNRKTRTGSLLAIGEILDFGSTKSSRTTICPVIALAVGEAGHILQLSAIRPEKWIWNESSIVVGASQAKFQGTWCGDGSPISKIEFVTKLKRHDHIRWLIAQKDTSTTIFEPELRATPTVGSTQVSGLDNGIADRVVMNPVATLPINVTGGEGHSDFSVNLGPNDLDPQLAIIDRSGNWSIWYIRRSGHGRSKSTKAMLMKKGNWTFPTPFPSDLDHVIEAYRIVWTTRSSSIGKWERDSSPSAQPDPLPGGSQAAYLADLDAPRSIYDGLVMCTHTQLQVLDVEAAASSSWLDFFRRDGGDIILDAQTFYGSSSHVFILTTEKLHLLDMSLVDGQESKSPHILASCRHFRNSQREPLKMSVTKLRSGYGNNGALVSVHSAHSFRVDLFCFVISQRDGIAKFHRQTVHFPGLQTANIGEEPQGIESLTAVPLHVVPSKDKGRHEPDHDTDGDAHVADIQLHQLFALTSNLSLSSSIVALMQGVEQESAMPFKADDLGWNGDRRARFLRSQWLREAEQAFVIPDQAEEVQSLRVVHAPSQIEGSDTIQLRFYLVKLVQEINRAYAGDAAEGPSNLAGPELFKPLWEALKSREDDDHIALKPLLSFSDLWQPFNLSTLEDIWDSDSRRLSKSQQTRLFECGTYGPKQSILDLFEKMSINWSAKLPAESFKASQWRYVEKALEKMAAEVYMSERGVYMMPQSTLDLASRSALRDETQVQDIDADGVHPSPSQSSQVLPTPSATPSSSRATSEVIDSATPSQADDEATELEDPAVARLRMYLPSLKFTPPAKSGPSRVICLWPEQRGFDPLRYQYRPPGQGPNEKAEARQRRQEREEARRQRRAERRAQLGIKMEGVGQSYSQPDRPEMIRSSPPPHDIGSSQQETLSQGLGGFRFGSQSQRQKHSQGLGGSSQIMSQPLPGEFGGRPRLKKGKPGFFAPGFR